MIKYIYNLLTTNKTNSEKIGEIKITLTIPKGIHISPKYYGYKGSFDNINVCNICNRTALYEDMHQLHPCPNCGGEIIEKAFVGIWDKNKNKWLKREEYFEDDIRKFIESKSK